MALITLRLGRRVFSPSLVPSLVVLLIFPVLFSLGMWQLGRAEEKRLQLHLYEQRAQGSVVELARSVDDPASLRFQHVRISGRLDSSRQFLLDNRIHQQVPGYYVLTPLKMPGRQEALLINRGWVPLGDARGRLPDIHVNEQDVRLSGHVYAPFGKAFSLGGMDTADARWPRVIQYLDFAAIEKRLGYPVLPFTVRLDEGVAEGYERDWRPVSFKPERHIAYAVQWFGLAATLLVIYVAVNTKRLD